MTLATSQAFAEGRHSREAGKARDGAPSSRVKNYRFDDEVTRRANVGNPFQTTSVIVTLAPGAQMPTEFKRFARGGRGGNLDIINGAVLDLPNWVIKKLSSYPNIFRIHYNRPIGAHNYRTAVTVGTLTARYTMGLSGAGVGVAVIDSGISTWHDDLTVGPSTKVYPYGNQRVTKFVDFVNGRTQPYDDNGHGTHVAGIIAGNGYDSKGEKAGIAPEASIISLKVLDADGRGTISNIIAALNWVAVNAKTYNIRVVNMSVGAGVFESYWTDPLTLATKSVVDQGIVVVAAAGNLGKNAQGKLQYGAITAPGNAPWVLTVGASSTMGTLTRNDDQMANYSSSGPTAIDFLAKPDLVAPGTGTISLAVPGSLFYATKASFLISGKLATASVPYLALSGTSMAAPVVSGTVAMMLQVNPSLTPNLVKAILQYTAQQYPGYHTLRQGAGFLNSLGALRLARYYANPQQGERLPTQKVWSKQIIWGTHRLKGGIMDPKANAWATQVVWGSARTLGDLLGDNVVWGTTCGTCDNLVWGTTGLLVDNVVWGTTTLLVDNVVWGTTLIANNVVWGTTALDNVVWGTDCGGADCDNVVWGTVDPLDNVVWGTADLLDNVVWGTSGLLDNVVWATASDGSEEAVGFPPDDATQPAPDPALEFGEPVATPTPDPAAATTVAAAPAPVPDVTTTVPAPAPVPDLTTTAPAAPATLPLGGI